MGFYGPLGPGGFRRRGRRRGLIIGAAAGSSIASRREQRATQDQAAKQKDYKATEQSE